MKISDTCKKKECKFWKKHSKDFAECPFYTRTIWEDNDDPGVTAVLHDCSPQRDVRLLMNYDSRAIGIQQDFDDMQKTANKMVRGLQKVVDIGQKQIEQMKKRNAMLEQALQIEQKKVKLLEHK
jgi:hypothetical protein